MVSGFELKNDHYLCFVVVLVVVNLWCGGLAEPQVPCYFIFGNSLVDNGNNNNIASLARANYMPYGIDFPAGPTGRFSNGKTTVDVIAELLGFEDYIPPYSSTSGEAILKGVNYASAAAGIRQETGQQLGARIPFGGQVSNYQNTVSQVVNILGDEDTAANYLSKCIYSVGLGSNDYLNNYFVPNTYSTSRRYTPEQYDDVLIQQYSQQLRALYNYGARKFVLIGIGQIGCSPNALSNSKDGSTCVAKINSANQLFNRNLKSLVNELNTNLKDARFMYMNAYDIFPDLIDRPSAFDTLAELVDFIPPYASPRVQDILNADVGIRQVTDQQSGVQIAFRGQMWLFVFIFMWVSNSKPFARGEPQVPCYFVLGDSTADPGNNNDLVTIAKANYPPYGIDFPQGVATGRFCNGRNIVDIISELLGFDDFIPAYAGIKNNVLKGVNYASGAAGIRNESGIQQGQRISLNAQLVNHKTIVAKIVVLLGSKDAALKYLNKCIYSVGMGSNDYLNNYFLPDYYPTSRLYTPEQYATVLIQQYSTQLKTLYNLGARKVVLIGLGLLGYTPIELLLHSSGDPPTALDINNAVELFNVKLKTLVDDFNQNLTDAKFILINSTAISAISTATTPSYNVTTAACCIVTGTNYTCDANTVPCTDRDGYVYFDNIHPTEIVNKYLGSQYYNASVSSFTYPYDISHLAQL